MYHYFAKALVEEMGEEKGKEVIDGVIKNYGEYCGQVIREEVEAQGLTNDPENMHLVRDLPSVGWESDIESYPDGEERPIITHCPFAATWLALGEEAVKYGRWYCHVDQAKQAGYNPDYEFIHSKNVLDGDPHCEFLLRLKR